MTSEGISNIVRGSGWAVFLGGAVLYLGQGGFDLEKHRVGSIAAVILMLGGLLVTSSSMVLRIALDMRRRRNRSQ